jgi:hypothetical protein
MITTTLRAEYFFELPRFYDQPDTTVRAKLQIMTPMVRDRSMPLWANLVKVTFSYNHETPLLSIPSRIAYLKPLVKPTSE